MGFTAAQDRSIEIAERTTSVVSLIGSLFIISTFTFFPVFRKPINRLIMYASLGNVLCNIATLVSITGLEYGEAHPLCKFQAFLIQMFIPADSLWTFCMALNVYLTFFKSCDSSHLRALEKWYFVFCYGTPLVPALIFLFIDVSVDAGIYGPAMLWCWISVKWDWMRIAFFYGPVWIIIAITTTIYLVTGKAIFKHRAALRAFSKNPSVPMTLMENPFANNDLTTVTKVTEIEVTTETIQSPVDGLAKCSSVSSEPRSSFSSTRNLSKTEATPHPKRTSIQPNDTAAAWPFPVHTPAEKTVHDSDPTTNYTTTISAGVPNEQLADQILPQEEESVRPPPPGTKRRNAAMHANTAAWGYAKVAMLMFLALFIVWVPSTINRVYSLVHPTKANFGLSFAAGFVLPLQGFWNCMVYISTSWGQCRSVWRDMFGSRRRHSRQHRSADLRDRLAHLNHRVPGYYRQGEEILSKQSSFQNPITRRTDLGDLEADVETTESRSQVHQDINTKSLPAALPLATSPREKVDSYK